jgi:NTP pyrophosphatase (non-canonical NTP hydrolase)
VGTITQIQSEHSAWLARNFPDQTPLDGFLGIVEEVGELSHAILKHKQGIRGYAHADPDKYSEQLEDALGDLFIFMCSFCNSNHLELETIIMRVWGKVRDRDWLNDSEMGGE